MISKAELLTHARSVQLTPEVVEKDYVLGWLLSAIAHHPDTQTQWVFKGGTCLKKCVVETWRFSEDLDFSLTPDAAYTAEQLTTILRDVASRCHDSSGLVFPDAGLSVRERRNRQGQPTFEGSVAYRGPLAFPGSPKIRFDLTRNEPILRPAESRTIFHPYSDALPPDARVASYSLGELMAEKTRALWERTRPRDLYDVVLLGTLTRNAEEEDALRQLTREKFEFKGLVLPDGEAIVEKARADAELQSEWKNMLAHQLPVLPPLDDFLARLEQAIGWLFPHPPEPISRTAGEPRSGGTLAGARLGSIPLERDEVIEYASRAETSGQPTGLDPIRFAGASHLLLDFIYHGNRRVVEPYALRRPKTGNLLLYAHERSRDGAPTDMIKAYKIHEIGSLRVLQTAFQPRYVIELSERPGTWRW